jgi:nitrogen fixation/metabolism regulation signal transduction histidine kinase
MRKSRFSESQIIGIIKEHEAGARVADLCRRYGISAPTLYSWKAKYGGLEVLVQTLVPEFAVEALQEAVLHRFAGRDVVPGDAALRRPFQHRVAGQLSAVAHQELARRRP